ncbi:MAG: hypothetical protein ACRD18_02245 [Terriglobia bacterium]
MKVTSCDREIEVLGAVQTGRWPEASGPDLRAHVAACSICAEVTLVACALLETNEWAGAETHPLPQADLVWWKAQLRARHEAVERASQPIAIFEQVAYAFGCLALLGMAIWQRARIEDWLSDLGWFGSISHQTYLRVQEFLITGSLLPRWVPEWTSMLVAAAVLVVITFVLRVALVEE